MDLWVREAAVHGYADDTSTSVSAPDEATLISKLEVEAGRILRFMASNELTVNPQKTGLLIIRKNRLPNIEITVGGERISESESHRILGLTVNGSLSWSDHVYGKGGLLAAVNQRIGAIKRLSHQIPRRHLPQIANAIVVSKVRYGLSLYCPTRTNEQEPTTGIVRDIQVALNKTMRAALGCRLRDRVPISELSARTRIQGVNQMSAADKLLLMWRTMNDPTSPLINAIPTRTSIGDGATSRAKTRGDIPVVARSSLGERNFPTPGIRLWNASKPSLRQARNVSAAKREIKAFTDTLPFT